MDAARPATWTFRLTASIVTWLVPLSLFLFVGSMALYGWVHWSRLGAQPVPGGWSAFADLLGVLVAVIVVHEALHGVGFRLFGGRPKFGLAFASTFPVAYAACPGRRFTRGQFLVIGALPVVVIDAVAIALGAFAPLASLGAAAIAINSAGAVADLWTIALLLQSPPGSLFEDSDGRSIVAWYPPGSSARPPRGLSPPGLRGPWLFLGVLLLAFPLVAFPLTSFAELFLAEALGGVLRVGGIELTVVSRQSGHLSARQNVLATLMVALLVTIVAATVAESIRRRRRQRA